MPLGRFRGLLGFPQAEHSSPGMARSFPPFLYCSIPDRDKQLYCLNTLHSKLSLYSITSQLRVMYHTPYELLFKRWAHYCIFG